MTTHYLCADCISEALEENDDIDIGDFNTHKKSYECDRFDNESEEYIETRKSIDI
jgi:hypothetical protein